MDIFDVMEKDNENLSRSDQVLRKTVQVPDHISIDSIHMLRASYCKLQNTKYDQWDLVSVKYGQNKYPEIVKYLQLNDYRVVLSLQFYCKLQIQRQTSPQQLENIVFPSELKHYIVGLSD